MKFFLMLLGLALGTSCATVSSKRPMSYLEEVQIKYEKAEKAFFNQEWDIAYKLFEEIRSKHAYSKYAALSDLRLGDLFFEQEKWLEAADSYDFFIRFHPRHEKSAYAWFQMAKSHVSAIPKDFFLFPKSYMKDQSATEQALSVIERFLAEYPNDKNFEKAQKMRVDLRSQIAARDLHVAKYYINRNHKKGALLRLQHLISTYPDTLQGQEAVVQLNKLDALK